MNKVKLVTGYCPLPILNVSEEKYRAHGETMKQVSPVPWVAYDEDPVDKCWSHGFVKSMKPHFAGTYPRDRFPDEWTACCSAIVNLNKTKWLTDALKDDNESDVFVWVDYGILKQTGMLPTHLVNFLLDVKDNGEMDAIVFPGLVDKDEPMSWGVHHTRFCGSVLVVPRDMVWPFHAAVMQAVHAHVHGTGTLSYDVNYFASVERSHEFCFRQYRAWWDQTQFTAYTH